MLQDRGVDDISALQAPAHGNLEFPGSLIRGDTIAVHQEASASGTVDWPGLSSVIALRCAPEGCIRFNGCHVVPPF